MSTGPDSIVLVLDEGNKVTNHITCSTSVAEIAATVLRMARAGTIPCVKVAKLWRFSVSQLDAWVASGTSIGRG